jgi:ribosomal protein S18 acetylase RimI-like enzyme
MSVEILAPNSGSATEVVDVFCDAFYDYPVMRYVLGTESPDYDSAIRTLIGLFVRARVFRQELLLGIPGNESLAAAAIVSRSDGAASPPEFFAFRERVWTELGPEAEARYDALGEVWEPFQIEGSHLHLNMIGVRSTAQGRGLARRLLDRVHALSATDPKSHGVSLSTEIEANVALYKYFGYELIGESEIEPGLRTWGFYRPD